MSKSKKCLLKSAFERTQHVSKVKVLNNRDFNIAQNSHDYHFVHNRAALDHSLFLPAFIFKVEGKK